MKQQRLAKGKGGFARSRLKEALRQAEARRDHGVLVATYGRLSKTLATQSGLRRAEVALAALTRERSGSATQAGMTNAWLAEQGLISIKPKRSEIESDEKRARKRRPRQTLRVAFHYPAAAHSTLDVPQTRMSGVCSRSAWTQAHGVGRGS